MILRVLNDLRCPNDTTAGVVARLAAQVAAFYASASTGLGAYASLKGRPQADKTWAQLLEWNEKAFGAWAQVHAAAERYISPTPPLHLPYISQARSNTAGRALA